MTFRKIWSVEERTRSTIVLVGVPEFEIDVPVWEILDPSLSSKMILSHEPNQERSQ